MVSGERQKIIEANRSLRLIKNELESLLEKGVITEAVFDSIHHQLPTEASISEAGIPTVVPLAGCLPTNLSLPNTTTTSSTTVDSIAFPPSYNSTCTSGGNSPPPLPGRSIHPPAKPILCRARALYQYNPADARDLALWCDDNVVVLEYMNEDWWLGRNDRTGQEGIFPKTYVRVEQQLQPAQKQTAWAAHDEKSAAGATEAVGVAYPPPQQQFGAISGAYPPSSAQTNLYNVHAPPMALANEQQQQQGSIKPDGKVASGGKKLGKKLGNAAIFGAGATIGSNIVNSIF